MWLRSTWLAGEVFYNIVYLSPESSQRGCAPRKPSGNASCRPVSPSFLPPPLPAAGSNPPYLRSKWAQRRHSLLVPPFQVAPNHRRCYSRHHRRRPRLQEGFHELLLRPAPCAARIFYTGTHTETRMSDTAWRQAEIPTTCGLHQIRFSRSPGMRRIRTRPVSLEPSGRGGPSLQPGSDQEGQRWQPAPG